MAETKRRVGRWILKFPDTNISHYVCSECGEKTNDIPKSFDMFSRKNIDSDLCPFCGVQMAWDMSCNRVRVYFK